MENYLVTIELKLSINSLKFENCYHQGCNGVQSARSLMMFQMNILPSL
jgi:hypothetical protein